jgi:hypothetical protein
VAAYILADIRVVKSPINAALRIACAGGNIIPWKCFGLSRL